LIGEAGVEALTSRAVHVTERGYPWLAAANDPAAATPRFAHVISCLERQNVALAAEAAAAVLATFTGLLATFVGGVLTMRLIHQAWPEGFSDAAAGETRA